MPLRVIITLRHINRVLNYILIMELGHISSHCLFILRRWPPKTCQKKLYKKLSGSTEAVYE